jgi:hypothetical protein
VAVFFVPVLFRLLDGGRREVPVEAGVPSAAPVRQG